MSSGSKISIAMAVYNGERFIREQLESFVRQTRLPDELVVSDNVSTDRTVEIVREFAARAPFLVRLFINESNLGVTKNFERAIRACTGDIIFLSDCDDVWYPEKIALTEKVFQQQNIALVQCDADFVNERLESIGRSVFDVARFNPERATYAELRRGRDFNSWVPICGNSMAFRASLKTLILPLPQTGRYRRRGHDEFIAWTILFSGVGQIGFISDRLLAYRQHPAQMTGLRATSSFQRLRKMWQGRGRTKADDVKPIVERVLECKFVPAGGQDPQWKQLLYHYRLRAMLPRSRFRRLPYVAAELLSARYHKYSNGFGSAAKDLFFVEGVGSTKP